MTGEPDSLHFENAPVSRSWELDEWVELLDKKTQSKGAGAVHTCVRWKELDCSMKMGQALARGSYPAPSPLARQRAVATARCRVRMCVKPLRVAECAGCASTGDSVVPETRPLPTQPMSVAAAAAARASLTQTDIDRMLDELHNT